MLKIILAKVKVLQDKFHHRFEMAKKCPRKHVTVPLVSGRACEQLGSHHSSSYNMKNLNFLIKIGDFSKIHLRMKVAEYRAQLKSGETNPGYHS